MERKEQDTVKMSTIRNLLRPIFRLAVQPHINVRCKETQLRFESFKDKYKGQRCFIVANGPSLRISDLDRFDAKHEITFGMNRIYALFDKTTWKPTFYMSQDPTVLRACLTETRKQIQHSTVFVKIPGEPKYDIPGAVNYDLDYANADNGTAPKFLDGKDCRFADGKSVTYTALQLAVYMGFTAIYLVGADCSYSNDNKHITPDSYPDKRMYDPRKMGMPPDVEYLFKAYKSAREYAESHGINIYNATRGGMLEVFQRVDLDSLFEEER